MITNEGVELVCLLIITVFTVRGCYFCWKAFPTDYAGKWITVGELLASVCWIIIGIDIILRRYVTTDLDLLTTVFSIAFAIKAISTVIKSEHGYKIIRRTYSNYRAQLEEERRKT